jgi:hypothetical protein
VVVEGRVETRLARKEIPGSSPVWHLYGVPLHGSTPSSDPTDDDGLAANPKIVTPKIGKSSLSFFILFLKRKTKKTEINLVFKVQYSEEVNRMHLLLIQLKSVYVLGALPGPPSKYSTISK